MSGACSDSTETEDRPFVVCCMACEFSAGPRPLSPSRVKLAIGAVDVVVMAAEVY